MGDSTDWYGFSPEVSRLWAFRHATSKTSGKKLSWLRGIKENHKKREGVFYFLFSFFAFFSMYSF